MPQTTQIHDFASVQQSLTQYQHQRPPAPQAWILQQTSPTTQTLTPSSDTVKTSYTIKYTHKHGLKKNKDWQGQIEITKHFAGSKHDTTTSLLPTPPSSPPQTPTTSLRSSVSSHSSSSSSSIPPPASAVYTFPLNNHPHTWHPLGPSSLVFHLTPTLLPSNPPPPSPPPRGQTLALFVFANQAVMKSGIGPRPTMCGRVGSLHLVRKMGGEGEEEVLRSVGPMVEGVRTARWGCSGGITLL